MQEGNTSNLMEILVLHDATTFRNTIMHTYEYLLQSIF